MVGNPGMRDRDVAGVVGKLEVLKPVGWSKSSKTSVTELLGESVYPRSTTCDVGERGRERELRVENFGELWIRVGPDVSAEESEDAGQRGLALVG